MNNGCYVDKKVSMYSILFAVISLLFAYLLCCLWISVSKNRDNYQQNYIFCLEEVMDCQNPLARALKLNVKGIWPLSSRRER